jgi:hypothetical protein
MSNRQHNDRFHGRVGNGTARCAYPGCGEAGDFRAPSSHGRRGGSDGPGEYQLLCLDHVREFNAGYDWFAGMSAEQIAAAQSPTYTWPNETRAFSAAASVDAPPRRWGLARMRTAKYCAGDIPNLCENIIRIKTGVTARMKRLCKM